ncbi:hypothetical protein PoB_003227100 [Plakobranchus ocellatus]|uniref:Uncharacterized protein n=1 Tax=Plakobranchus ocellatus TaxID=259542 RepID=A0AAV4ABP8_9GAST|nr:hypothetical protein PoB_003227100 [Plakobranchus ocellatus]
MTVGVDTKLDYSKNYRQKGLTDGHPRGDSDRGREELGPLDPVYVQPSLALASIHPHNHLVLNAGLSWGLPASLDQWESPKSRAGLVWAPSIARYNLCSFL